MQRDLSLPILGLEVVGIVAALALIHFTPGHTGIVVFAWVIGVIGSLAPRFAAQHLEKVSIVNRHDP